MSPAAAALLYFLGKEPFTRVSDMTRAPGFRSPAEVNNALSFLEHQGFLNREEYKVSKRGRKSIFAVLTEKAIRYLGIKGIKGKGSYEHKLDQDLISKWHIERGIEATVEGRIKGSTKPIDVLTHSKERGYTAYEVSLHLETVLLNVHRDISAGADEVVIVTRDQADLERAIQIVSEDPSLDQHLEKISFSVIADFFS
jgi:hypothetical protein